MKKIWGLGMVAALVCQACGGSGLPSCDGDEAKKIVRDILIQESSYDIVVGTACVLPANRSIRKVPTINKTERDGTCDPSFQRISDADVRLSGYLVTEEQKPQDGRSMMCAITTKARVSSKTAGIDDELSKQYRIDLQMFQKDESGNRQYKYNYSY